MNKYNPAILIANNIIYDAKKHNTQVSPMKMQKLLYFIYKKHLKDTGVPLFDEYFEVWERGPVLPSVFHEFKSSSKQNINDYVYTTSKGVPIVSKDHDRVYDAINYVLNKYRWHSATELSDLTHKDDTAWTKAFDRSELYLLDDEIKDEAWHG